MWVHFATVRDNEKVEMYGTNLWDFDWNDTKEKIEVIDPNYKNTHLFTVFEIIANNLSFKFVAGEFSNGVWGFYTNNNGATIL